MSHSRIAVAADGSRETNEHNVACDHIGQRPTPYWTFRAFAPAGGLRSTAADIARFLSACLNPDDSPLRDAILASYQVQSAAPDFGCDVGIGWFIDRGSDNVVWHAGATAGSRAFVALNRSRRQAVAVLANSDNGVSGFALELLGSQRRELVVAPPPPNNPSDFVGTFAGEPDGSIEVRRHGKHLSAEAVGWSGPILLRELAPDRFAVPLMPAQIVFQRDGEGTVVSLTTDVSGSEVRMTRKE